MNTKDIEVFQSWNASVRHLLTAAILDIVYDISNYG